MTHSFAQDRKHVERRHHRIDAELQARARPYSLIRKDTAKEIREFVERQDEHAQMDRRLLPVGGGGDSGAGGGGGGDGGNSPSGGSGSGSNQSGGSGGSGGNTGTVGGGNGGGSSTGGGNTGTGTGSGTGTGTKPDKGTGTGSNTGNSGNSGNSGDRSGSGTGTGNGADGADTDPSTSSSSTASKPKGIFGGLSSLLHHSSTSSSSSTQTTTSSSSTSTSTSSTSLQTPFTSVAYVTPTAAVPTLNNAAASATPSDTSNNGPGAGLIIGIVAGALAGIAVLAALIGFLIKKFGRKDDPYESDPFDSDEFRRQSAMLPDTFDDVDHNPEMSEMNHHNNVNPFNDEMEYAAGGIAGAGAASAFTARNESGGPRPPTMFQKHMNAPAAQLSVGDAPPVPMIGSVFNPNRADPTPQLPTMAFGGSDPYSMAGVGRPNFDNNINNPYGYLDRQYSGSRSPPQEKGYADLDRTGSDGSMHGKSAGQMYSVQETDDYRSYDYHDTAGRPGTAEGRSGTPDLPNVQQTYAMDRESDDRVGSPNRQMVASPTHLSQDFLSNGNMQQYQQYSQAQQSRQYNHDQYNDHHQQNSRSASPASQPLQVRNLLPNPHLAVQQKGGQRPVSGVSSVADDEAAYGGVW